MMIRRTWILTAVCCIASGVVSVGGPCGCASEGSARGTGARGAGHSGPSDLVRQVDRTHVIGPSAASALNYRIAWQFEGLGSNLRLLTVEDDAAFALDEDNYLSRVRTDDGQRLWRVQAADPIEVILGVTLLDSNVYVTTGGAILVLDGNTGAQIGRQPLEKIASTAPVHAGPYLIYGSRNGQAVWHSYQIAYQWRAYQIAQSILIKPLLVDNRVVMVGNDGSVMVLNASNATQIWGKRLLDRVTARPAADAGAVYVAGGDQHLWCYDMNSGRNLWRVLTESPLTESPTLLGDRVYQQIPTEGLACFVAQPLDAPGGERLWTAKEQRGNVVAQRRDDLLVWDAQARRLTMLESKRGGEIASVDLPQAEQLIIAGENQNDIYAASRDGRLVRLVSR